MDPTDLFKSFFVSGGYLPLNKQELNLASLVYPVAQEVVNKEGSNLQLQFPENHKCERKANSKDCDEDVPFDFEEKVEATKENFARILDLFRQIDNARQEYTRHFPEWCEIRKKNVCTLEELGKSLHLDKFNCNVSRLVGASVGVLGTCALLSCLAFPPAAAAIVPLTLGGGGAALTGSGVVFGATVTEWCLIKQKMSKAQEILQIDQKSFEPFSKYFKHTLEFVAAVDAVLGFHVMVKLATDLKEFIGDVASWNNVFISQLKNTLTFIVKSIQLPYISSAAQLVPVVLTFCVVAVLSHKKNCIILDGITLTHRLVFGFLSILDLGSEVGRAVMVLVNGGRMTAEISSTMARAVFNGVFGGVGLALDVINIILTSIDVHKGSLSKQGTLILNAATKLNEELEFLKEVYDKLNEVYKRKLLHPKNAMFCSIKTVMG